MSRKRVCCVDPKLHLNSVVWRVLGLLKKVSLPIKRTPETTTLYNGRERGIVIALCEDDLYEWSESPANDGFSMLEHDTLYVSFAECRGSDQICVYNWRGKKTYMNPPTVEDFPSRAYKDGKYFSTPSEAVEHITKLLRNAIKAFKDLRKVEKVMAA